MRLRGKPGKGGGSSMNKSQASFNAVAVAKLKAGIYI